MEKKKLDDEVAECTFKPQCNSRNKSKLNKINDENDIVDRL